MATVWVPVSFLFESNIIIYVPIYKEKYMVLFQTSIMPTLHDISRFENIKKTGIAISL